MSLAGEDSIHSMNVVESTCIACEAHRSDLEDWADFAAGPVRFLKKALGLATDDILHVWGKKHFKAGKTVPTLESAESAFLMLRVKAKVAEATLRISIPGLFTSPCLETGEPDWAYKVIWCPEKTVPELRILASSMPGALGVVKSRHIMSVPGRSSTQIGYHSRTRRTTGPCL